MIQNQKKSIKKKLMSGFTLVELLIGLGVLAILVVAATPSFLTSSVNNRLYSEKSQVLISLDLARAEALRQNNYVSICATSNASTCSSGTDFSTGMIIFNNPGQAGLTSSSQIIRIIDPWTKKDKGKSNITNGTLTFNGNGRTNVVANILVCLSGYNSYSINIAGSGNIMTTNNNGDGGC